MRGGEGDGRCQCLHGKIKTHVKRIEGIWQTALREREAQCVLVSEQLAQAGVTDRVSEEGIR